MWFVDAFASYLFGLKFIAIGLALMMLVSGLDDLVIDVVYWLRRCWRTLTVYRTHDRLDYTALYEPIEQPLAIMVPAWHETGVIGQMAEFAATTLDYENYHIFVGTYPNDPDTQRDVDVVCARFPNVHKVVCARPGPTSKADCLNNVLDAILQFEQRAGLEFAGFILHDAEDVISPMELRLFNWLVGRKDLIQLPVYPFQRSWTDFTSAHYMDEFAELHGKDILVREAIAGQVPSAGVGTCFSRRAVMALLADGDGIAFDVQSLTEDYDIGIRLRAKGLKEIFVRFPVVGDPRAAAKPRAFGMSERETNVICVREYFPNTMSTAVRQKSRWIIGIVYQGFKNHKWTASPAVNYFLWRDRKGGVSNFVSFLSTLIFLQLTALYVYQLLAADPYRFLSIFEGDRWLTTLLSLNFLLMCNRMVQRAFFVTTYYGLIEGLLSAPRLVWGNLINFMANWRAIRQVIAQGDPRRVAWDKTTHDFPMIGETNRSRRPLGQILVEQGALTEAQLQHALEHRARGLKLGSWLVQDGRVSGAQLAAAVAEQAGVSWEDADLLAVDPALIGLVPSDVALHYAVLPLRDEGTRLVLASESYLDPVSAAALARKVKRQVAYVIVPKGHVTVGLRHWHLQGHVAGGRQTLDAAIAAGQVTRRRGEAIWQEYVSRQVLFAEILMSLGHLDTAALNAALLRHERSALSLGEYMVEQGMISEEVLQEALDLQLHFQGTMGDLLAREDQAPRHVATLEAVAV